MSAARAESGRIDAEMNQRRQREVGALLVQAQQLRAEIDRLTCVERQYRDMRILGIGGGTTEILTSLAAKTLGYQS